MTQEQLHEFVEDFSIKTAKTLALTDLDATAQRHLVQTLTSQYESAVLFGFGVGYMTRQQSEKQ